MILQIAYIVTNVLNKFITTKQITVIFVTRGQIKNSQRKNEFAHPGQVTITIEHKTSMAPV
jgi:hypothetical protein